MGRNAKLKGSKSGRMRSSIWITHENSEGSSLLTLRTRNLGAPSRMLVRNWKRQWFPLCLAKLWRRIVGVVNPTKVKQNLRVMNLQECVWEIRYQIIMKTILQERRQLITALQFCHKLIDFFASNYEKFMQQTQRWTRNGKNWRISAWNLTKVRSNKTSDLWSEDEGRKSFFCITDGHTSFEKCWIGGKNTKTPRWYCKRWFCVSRSFHWTRIISISAANVMDIISRLPGCLGQAADAVSAYTQEMVDGHKLLKLPKSHCPDIWIRLPRHKWPTSWSSIEDPVVVVERNLYGHPSAGLMGKASCEDPFEAWLGENSKLGVSLCTSWKRIILIYVCVGR